LTNYTPYGIIFIVMHDTLRKTYRKRRLRVMKDKHKLMILAVLAIGIFVASAAFAAHVSPVDSHGFGVTALKGGNGGGENGPGDGTGNGGSGPADGSGYGPGSGSGTCDGTGPKGPGVRNDKN